jgi:hypothetical protein
MNKLAITAAALAAGIVLQTEGFAQIATTSSAVTATAVDPELVAHENWRALMANNDVPTEGCFHASYPNFVWESVDCKVAQPRVHPVHIKLTDRAAPVAQAAGNGNDYVAQAQGLITQAVGLFKVTGVKSETGVGVAESQDLGILGPNEYSLQINTNADQATYPCRGHGDCTAWQQFIYATDYAVQGEAAVFMQFWLLGWGSSACPIGWTKSKSGVDCYGNSAQVAVPDLPITDLGYMQLSAKVTAGGLDVVTFSYAGDAWATTGRDGLTDIGMVWNQAEFNVVGDGGGSEAVFNPGSTITVSLFVFDGSDSAPACVGNSDQGQSGETNNLNLGLCQAAFVLAPVIQFNESLPSLHLLPPIVGPAPVL